MLIVLLLLPLIMPIFILICVFIVIADGFPVFYKGPRVGFRGSEFYILKFRTMVKNADKIGGPSTALNDPRLIPIGRTLRKFKLDELPQLFNILYGQMTVVGPRPQVKMWTDLYDDNTKRVFDTPPGLTDYASIEFFDMDSVLGVGDADSNYIKYVEPRKNALRLKYVDTQSIKVDLLILIQTIKKLVIAKS